MRTPLALFILALVFPTGVSGQNIFKGGSGSGYSAASSSSISLGLNIFQGGSNSGYGYAQGASQILGVNIFKGGPGEGYSWASVVSAQLGVNIYEGGFGSGYSTASSSVAKIGVNIYSGGIASGYGYSFSSLVIAARMNTFENAILDLVGEQSAEYHLISFTSNNDLKQFEIERMVDGERWVSLDIPIHKSDSGWFAYIRPNGMGDHHYRIGAVDIMDRLVESEVVVVSSADHQVEVYPNPAGAVLQVRSTSHSQAIVKIIDITGKLMYTTAFMNETLIETDQFPAGVYLVSIRSHGQLVFKKISIRH